MSSVLDNSDMVFSGSEFKAAWGLLLSKQQDPAKSLELFTVSSSAGAPRFNVGITCLVTGRVIFPARSHENVSKAFNAIADALKD